jgi:hypothetical protein
MGPDPGRKRVGRAPYRCLLALAAGAVAAACGRPADRAAGTSSVQVSVLGQDSSVVRFRVCNNGFQPIRHVEFTAGGAGFTADTLLGQAHCAELARPGAYPEIDSASVVVTSVEGPS